MPSKWFLVSIAGALALGSTVSLGISEPDTAHEDFQSILIERLKAGSTLERFASNLEWTLRQADLENDGLDQDDIDAASDKGGIAIITAALALDPNHDGVLHLEELRTLAQKAFKEIDANADGQISKDEFRPIQTRREIARVMQYSPWCTLPMVEPANQIVVLVTPTGAKQSSVAVGGQERTTRLLDVQIEPGSDDIYLVLSSMSSTIWRISGATSRLQHVAVSSAHAADPKSDATAWEPEPDENASRSIAYPGSSAAGVIGLPAKMITIMPAGCLPARAGWEANPRSYLAGHLEYLLQRKPDALIEGGYAEHVTLPSGRRRYATEREVGVPPGFDEQLWKEAMSLGAGELEQVEAERVVSSADVEPYTVLPGKLGLAQLMADGSLQRVGKDRYRIVRALPRLPPDMTGNNAAVLILAPGIPIPSGDPGHGCVLREEADAVQIESGRCPPPPPIHTIG